MYIQSISHLFLILILTTILVAKEKDSTTETLLGEIVIENNFLNDSSKNSATTKEIEKKSSKNLKEAIEETPSIHFNIGSRGEADFNMRGFTSREVPILINGVPVYMPYNGNIDLFLINTEMIEEIKVNPGLSSVLYGPNTMGGSINIITKSPKEGLNFNIWDELGHKNQYNGGASLSYSKHGAYLLFSPQYWYKNGYMMPDKGDDIIENGALVKDNDMRENSYKKGYSTLLKLGFKNIKSNYELSWFHLDEERGMPIELNNKRARYWKFPEWSKDNITFISENKLTKSLTLKNRIFYDNYYNKLEGYKDIEFEKLKFDSIYDDYTYGFISNPKINFLEVNDIEFSVYYKHDVHREGEEELEINDYDKYEMDTFSVATEYRGEFELASITAGVSYDINTTTMQNNKLKTLNSINPQIKSTFWIMDDYSINVSVGKKTRFPTLKELFSGYIDRNIPNPDLNEETTIHYQLDANANFNLFKIKAEFYYSDVKDMIENITISEENDPNRVQQLQNIGKFHFIGTELSINTPKLYNYFSISASYTYQYSYSDKLKDNKVPFQPKNMLKAGLTIFLPIDAYIYTDMSFIGEQYELDRRDNFLTIPAYSLINIKYEQKFYEKFAFYLKVNNLLNTDYYTQNNFPLAGREMFLGIKYRY